MKKYLIIDSKMRDIHKEYFVNLGYTLIQIPGSTNTYMEISSHVDIFCTKIKDKIIFENNLYNILKNKEEYSNIFANSNIIQGSSIVKNEYPNDIQYNICTIGNNAIHNFKYTDSTVYDLIEKYNLVKININQGYSKCSIAVIDSNSCIVTDKKVYKELIKIGIEALLLDNTPEINLLNGKEYSKMNGFIGGTIVRVDNKIIVFGDMKYTNNEYEIMKFVNSKGLELVDFKNCELIDYGSIVEFREEDI